MIEKVGSSNLLQNYKTTTNQQKETKNNTEAPTIAKDIVNKETADATKAYVQGIIAPPKREIPPKRTSEELIKDLIKEGKVEGKDFVVNQLEHFKEIKILKNDKISKEFYYHKNKDNKETYEGYVEYHYPLETPKVAKSETNKNNGLKSTETHYNADGEFTYRVDKYDSNNSPYQNEEVNAQTTPYELQEYLNKKNIPYTTDLDIISDNLIERKIITFEKDKNEFTHYEILKDKNKDNEILQVKKSHYDKNNIITNELVFTKDSTSYTEYKDSFVA